MKIRHLALVAAISIFSTGNSWAQNTWSNTNTNNTNDASFIGSDSFSLSTDNMNISQSGANTTDFSSFCQFFTITFGGTRITQVVRGTSFSQIIGSASDPIEDPCL